jgi:cobalt-zinc-cadmium efflux system outer membrane protein
MFRRHHPVALLACLALAGCTSQSDHRGFESVQAKVSTLIQKDVDWHDPDDTSVRDARVHELLQGEVSSDTAVQIALLNNPGLQATFEDLGIANADLIEAGIIKNPSLNAYARFPDASSAVLNTQVSVALNFIDIILLPLRKKVEGMRFEAAKARVALAVLSLAAEVRVAYVQTQSAEARVALRKTMLEATQAASEFAEKLGKAGNLSELSVIPRTALFHQTKLDLSKAELELDSLREKLNRLLGIRASEKWKIAAELPALPEKETLPAAEVLEESAEAQRLDLDVQRREVEVIDKARALRHWGVYTAVEPGASTEKEPEGVRVTGPALNLEIPIFNRGQADRSRLRAQLRQSKDKLEALDQSVRSEVREAYARVLVSRNAVEYYRDSILPLRQHALSLATEHYNSMTLGPLDLLSAKQEQLASQLEQSEALRDYWVYRAELERAVGGSLPFPSPAGSRPSDHQREGGAQ